ncbi:hypothetical protein D9757_010151 [Collybiopsis confluens]|uniref:Ubiquitin-like protease family profile domain-containing protein n=1 Tax=Collybiopsis confluens TaxID=2823264 RepID=A0A8H5GTB0_9AGAR|nr:hypothetical protein D9757_010151 [Collybiopsis confluens]
MPRSKRKLQSKKSALPLCTLVECLPFGHTCRCNAGSLLELLALIKRCQIHLPFISLAGLSTATEYSQYQLLLDQHFSLPYFHMGDARLYTNFETQNKRLNEVASQLSTASVVQYPFTSCAKLHITLPSDSHALAVIENLRLLLRCIQTKQISLYNDWCKALDNSPETTEKMLRLFMEEAGQVSEHRWAKVAPLTLSDFTTLGVGQWLNDEVINYFIQKWCSCVGTTLGLSTFFACKILFQENSCTNAKTGTLTVADEEQAVKWCRKTLKSLCLASWDSVFIPIHENSSHWYSAYIDFRHKRIEIYDSLRDTCLANRQKPVLLRKNANLMLPNTYDCGVHTLWHLQHVLEFRRVCLGQQCNLDRLSFTDNMVGKRMRLAQEIFQDSQPVRMFEVGSISLHDRLINSNDKIPTCDIRLCALDESWLDKDSSVFLDDRVEKLRVIDEQKSTWRKCVVEWEYRLWQSLTSPFLQSNSGLLGAFPNLEKEDISTIINDVHTRRVSRGVLNDGGSRVDDVERGRASLEEVRLAAADETIKVEEHWG